MAEYIKREDCIQVVEKYFTDFLKLNPDICIDGIRSLPAADVIERKKQFIFWQYCKDLNDINDAIETGNGNWEQLKSADQIISVTYDTNHGLYVVIWRIPDEEPDHDT